MTEVTLLLFNLLGVISQTFSRFASLLGEFHYAFFFRNVPEFVYLTESEYGLMLGDELVTDREINTSKRWNIECDGPMERFKTKRIIQVHTLMKMEEMKIRS
ncbi:unnamed protein product [Trifolium pratense]|uniref:Uncharacterized protein n=1 Tax=Trifolium pratense TaxID=57577 RepID=A0ACB0KQG9_TRIPR|nr:unnamed protein product [Trifolium pratense]